MFKSDPHTKFIKNCGGNFRRPGGKPKKPKYLEKSTCISYFYRRNILKISILKKIITPYYLLIYDFLTESSMINQNTTIATPNVRPNILLTNILAGISTGIIIVILSVSFASIIFSGQLAEYLPKGVGIFLISATIVSAIIATFSSFPGTISLPQKTTVAILGLFATTIANQKPDLPGETLFATVIAAIIFYSVCSGLAFIILGQFNVSSLISYIPDPVIGGLETGIALLIAEGGIKIMTGNTFEITKFPQLFASDILIKWIPGLIFGLALFYIPRWINHFLVIPGIIAIGLAIFYLYLTISGISVAQAIDNGWLIQPIPQGLEIINLKAITIGSLNQADWSLIYPFLATFGAIWVTDAMMLLLNCSNIDLEVQQDIKLDKELKAAGIATLASAAGCGIGGYQDLSQTSFIFRLGARGRQNGWIAAGVCLGMFLLGGGILSLLPQVIIGGILMYLSWETIYRWLYIKWFYLSRIDYFTVIAIILVILIFGYVPGVIIGILATTIFFMVNYSRVSVSRRTYTGRVFRSNVLRNAEETHVLKETGDCIYILELQGFIFYCSANKLLNQIRDYLKKNNKVSYIMLDFRLVNDIYGSAVISFSKLKQIAQQQNLYLLFTNLSPAIQNQLEKAGCLDYTENSVCLVFPDLDRGLQWCEEIILKNSNFKRQELMPLLQQLEISFGDAALAKRLTYYLEPVDIKAGYYLFHQGEAFNGLYLVGSGRVTVVLELGDGQTKRIRTYTAGNTIGEMGLYRKARRMASVVADENSRLYFLSAKAFDKIEAEDPVLAANFHKFIVNLLAERLSHREEELKQLLN